MINKLIRTGIVSSINYKDSTVKVEFDNSNGNVSRDLPVIFKGVNDISNYSMPSVSERVLCVFLPEAENVGFVVGSYRDDKNKAQVTGKVKHLLFSDGTSIKYDLDSQLLEIDAVGDINITSGKAITISGGSSIDINTSGELNLKGSTVNIDGNINMKGGTLTVANVAQFSGAMTTAAINALSIGTAATGDIDSHIHRDAENRLTTGAIKK